jgi:membrane protease YdiL (CAAX protease family)
MKIFFSALAWLAVFLAAGAAAMLGFGLHVFHSLHHLNAKMALLGAEFGFNLFVFALCFARLPGARRPPAAPQAFGLAQGIWGMAAFGIFLVAGGALLANVLTLEDFMMIARHNPARVDFKGNNFILGAVCAGEFAAGLFTLWYLRRLGAGQNAALAWRAAPKGAYLAATACGLAIIAVVLVMFRLIPPDMSKLNDLPMAQLFNGPPITLIPLLFVAVLLGPALEEITFRGIAFGGIAARLGPVWAGVITTLIFMAAHAPEKIYYKPGFIDVGLLAATACVLRVKFGSIRPGIWMHILYNFGSMVASSLIS